MGIGFSIFLIAVGAVLTFAVHTTVNGISIQTIGVILMVVGALGLAVTMTIFAPRRRMSVERTTTAAPIAADRPVVRENVVEPVTRESVVERRDVY